MTHNIFHNSHSNHFDITYFTSTVSSNYNPLSPHGNEKTIKYENVLEIHNSDLFGLSKGLVVVSMLKVNHPSIYINLL